MIVKENHTLQNLGHIATVVGVVVATAGLAVAFYFNWASLQLNRQTLDQNSEALRQIDNLQSEALRHEKNLQEQELAYLVRPRLEFSQDRYTMPYQIDGNGVLPTTRREQDKQERIQIMNLGRGVAFQVKTEAYFRRYVKSDAAFALARTLPAIHEDALALPTKIIPNQRASVARIALPTSEIDTANGADLVLDGWLSLHYEDESGRLYRSNFLALLSLARESQTMTLELRPSESTFSRMFHGPAFSFSRTKGPAFSFSKREAE